MSQDTKQQGSTPLPQGQQQGQTTPTPQQSGGATPAPTKPMIRDWAAI